MSTSRRDNAAAMRYCQPTAQPVFLSAARSRGSAGRTHTPGVLFGPLTAARYDVRPTSWDNLAAVWTFENQVFGKDNISLETLRAWWSRYRLLALHLVDEAGQIAGTFDAYPLEAAAFSALLEGRQSERDLPATSVKPPRDGEIVPYWCVTALTLQAPLRRQGLALAALVCGLVERLVIRPEFGTPTALCATGQSPNGERLLLRLGFGLYRSASETRFELPTYQLVLASSADMAAFRTRLLGVASVLARRRDSLAARDCHVEIAHTGEVRGSATGSVQQLASLSAAFRS